MKPASRIKCPVFRPALRDRIRIVLDYQGSLRPIWWFQVDKDGSVYQGPRYPNLGELRVGRVAITGDEIRINYSEGETITNPDILKNSKLSFHGSGIIHTPGQRATIPRILGLKAPRILCHTLFAHPSSFDQIPSETFPKRDIRFKYPVAEDRPLNLEVFVAPKGPVTAYGVPGATYQANLFFAYSGLMKPPDLTLQLVFSHGPVGPWPPKTYVMFAANAGDQPAE